MSNHIQIHEIYLEILSEFAVHHHQTELYDNDGIKLLLKLLINIVVILGGK